MWSPQQPGFSVHTPFLAAQRWARANPRAYDCSLAVFFTVLSVLNSQESALSVVPRKQLTVVQVLVSLAAGLPHAVRRVAPLSALLMSFGLIFAGIAADLPDGTIQVIVCWLVVFGLAAYGDARSVRLGKPIVGLVTVGLLITATVLVFTNRVPYVTSSWGNVRALLTSYVAILAVVSTAWFGGVASRAREEHLALLADRAQEREEREAARARQAVIDERLRISRELHDVVAHHVSVMGVQAGAARRLMYRDTDTAAEMLSEIETSSRSAIAEMGRVVALLRSTTDLDNAHALGATGSNSAVGVDVSGSVGSRGSHGSHGSGSAGPLVDQPQPDVEQIVALVSDAQRAGMNVTLSVEGQPVPVPPSVGLSMYRIVQEALTNVRKHAALDAPTTVRIRYGKGVDDHADAGHGNQVEGHVELSIMNRGRISTVPVNGVASGTPVDSPIGHGLLGMRERVMFVGGSFSAGPIPGGYEVNAVMPTSEAAGSRATV